MEKVESNFPSIFTRIYDHMKIYNDEDMVQRREFVHNIPYFRGLEVYTINRIVYLIKSQTFDKGDLIFGTADINKNILIVWEGTVQVRVERRDPFTRLG